MSDNEHTLALLGDAEELSVQNSVGDPIPEFSQRPEDGTHGTTVRCHAPADAATIRSDVVGLSRLAWSPMSIGNAGSVSWALAHR